MKKIVGLIINNLKENIEAKIMLKREIKRIDEVVNTLATAQAEQCLLIEEFKKQSYKEKYREEHKKVKELEKQLKGLKK